MDVITNGEVSREKIWNIFEEKYSDVVAELAAPPSSIPVDQDPSIGWSYDRIKDLLDYNARSGKRMRGLAVVSSYLRIAGHKNCINAEDIEIALVLGWAIEIMQASFLVADDIMDQSKTRRGKPCWYKVKGIGLQAVNDSMLLESCVFILLKNHCRNKPYYADIVDLYREVIMLTELGQSLDMETSEKPEVDFSCFSNERYMSIVKYKTSFYSFYLPVAIALYITETNNSSTLQKSKEILTEMGCYFQVQDDYLDCFGDPSVTGKIGTDIESNKCSWLIVQALKHCSDEQRKILQDNYGKWDDAKKEAVFQVYKELQLEDIFHQYEEAMYKKLSESIMEVKQMDIPPGVYLDMLKFIYRRKK